MHLNPCPKCKRPALVGDGPGDTWQIGCFRNDCDQKSVRYQGGNKKSRAAAIRMWNSGKRFVLSASEQGHMKPPAI